MNQLDTKPPLEETPLSEPPVAATTSEEQSNFRRSADMANYLVLGGGVLVPAITLTIVAICCCRVGTETVLRHPVETLLQIVLASMIPVSNLLVWNRICQQKYSNAKRLGLLNGLAIGAGLIAVVVCAAGWVMGYPTVDESSLGTGHTLEFGTCAFVAMASVSSSIYLMLRLRKSWETTGARTSQLVFSLTGILLSLFALGATEGRATVIRAYEQEAANESGERKLNALSILRSLNCEQDLRMDLNCARSGGLSGMFFRLNPSARRQLYFSVASKPYQSISELTGTDESSGAVENSSYDRFLASHVVGDVLPNLSLVRSQISGHVNAKTLTSQLDWTFVLKNKNNLDQEARAEVALPPGAVVSEMTLWMNGVPKHATIGATEAANAAYRWVVMSKRDPALVRYLGNGRVLVQCYPVPANKEMKIQLSMTAPMKLDSGTKSSLTLPRMVSSNFVAPKTHDLRLLSSDTISLEAAKLQTAGYSGTESVYTGKLQEQEAKTDALSLVASRPLTVGAFAAKDTIQGGYAVESVKEVQNSTPHHLVVVVDGSAAMKDHKSEVTQMLRSVDAILPTSVIFANSDDSDTPEPISARQALDELAMMKFEGGHDNLPAAIKAAEVAGDKDGGAVLWIHGPQASFNEEIYITNNSIHRPAFYELAVDDGWTNTTDFFRNHREIGPMIPVTRNGKLGDDLNRFVSQWKPGGHHYSVQLFHMNEAPKCPHITGLDALDLSILCAASNVKQMICEHKVSSATSLASRYHIVTPVTAGVVLERGSDYSHWGLQERQAKPETRTAPSTSLNSRLANNDSLGGFSSGEARTSSNAVAIMGGDAFSASNTNKDLSQNAFGTAPVLQGATNGGILVSSIEGATNGTIGPQGSDATYITGLNTAGTVRVNNLANLEALLNLIATSLEFLGIATGVAYLIKALSKGFCPKYAALATVCVVAGLMVPGCINWIVASARDANLFN